MARLTMEEVNQRKQNLLEGKRLLSGKHGEVMFDTLLDYVDTIESQQQEIEGLKEARLSLIRKNKIQQWIDLKYISLSCDDTQYNVVMVQEKLLEELAELLKGDGTGG